MMEAKRIDLLHDAALSHQQWEEQATEQRAVNGQMTRGMFELLDNWWVPAIEEPACG